MMNIPSLNSLSSSAASFLQQRFFDSLTSQQQKVGAVALAALSFLAACYAIYYACFRKKPAAEPIRNPEPIVIPVASLDAHTSYAEGIKAFSFEMLGQMMKQADAKGNVMISPISISLVLSMIKHGISKKDQEELERIIRLPKDEKELKGCAYQLMEQLKAAGFDVANLVYLNDQYRLNPSYQLTVSQAYQSKVECGTSADEINAWVKKATHGQIKDIVKQDDLADFFVALLNAIHFKASWTKPFKKQDTYSGDFHVTASEKIKVEMMHDVRDVDYFENDFFQAIKLPYQDRDGVNMLLILPKENELVCTPPGETIFSSINASLFDEMNKGMERLSVKMALPKFDIAKELNVIPLLDSMGVSNLFGRPDFTPLVDQTHGPSMAALSNLYVAQVKQKSALKFDEEGTEASTVTMAIVVEKCMPMTPKFDREVNFDRPFFAALVKDETPLLFSVIKNPKG